MYRWVTVLSSLQLDAKELTFWTKPWRMVTTFFYFGSISLDFVFHLFFLCVLSIHTRNA